MTNLFKIWVKTGRPSHSLCKWQRENDCHVANHLSLPQSDRKRISNFESPPSSLERNWEKINYRRIWPRKLALLICIWAKKMKKKQLWGLARTLACYTCMAVLRLVRHVNWKGEQVLVALYFYLGKEAKVSPKDQSVSRTTSSSCISRMIRSIKWHTLASSERKVLAKAWKFWNHISVSYPCACHSIDWRGGSRLTPHHLAVSKGIDIESESLLIFSVKNSKRCFG